MILAGLVLGNLLLLLICFDVNYFLASESLCLIGLVLGLSITRINATLNNLDQSYLLFLDHIIAASGSYSAMNGLSNFSSYLSGKCCLGLGDAKLAAIGGAWIGTQGIFVEPEVAFISGGLFSLIGRILFLLRPQQAFPFVPFIASVIWSVWVFGNNWWIQQLDRVLGI